MKITLLIDHPLIEGKLVITALTIEEAKEKVLYDLDTFGHVIESLEEGSEIED